MLKISRSLLSLLCLLLLTSSVWSQVPPEAEKPADSGSKSEKAGVLTMMFYDPDKKIGFILLMNGEPKGRGIDNEIMEIMDQALWNQQP